MGFRKTAARLFLLAGLLSACLPSTPEPAPTSTPAALPTAQRRLETLEIPTSTVTATSSPSPSPSASPTSTITPSPTPSAVFDQLQILASDSIIGGVRITLALPGVDVPYILRIRGYEYKCVLDPQVKDRLYCVGLAQVPPGQKSNLVLLDPKSGQQVYAAEVFYAGFFTSTPQGYTSNSCPQRGEGANCEPECRQLPEGGYCVVATCTDACGVYFSVNTCPVEMSMDFNSCTEEQWAEAKLRYSIP